jgi:hypothetical protein
MQAWSWKSTLRICAVVGALICAAAVIYIPSGVPRHPTGPVNAILNNLRKIEGAKELYAQKHAEPRTAELTPQDLEPFLPHGFWERTVAGERYIIHSCGVPPEAVLTRGIQDLPAGTKLRFGNDGKVETIRPNETRQPTPGVRAAAYRASLARRGCADR